jgi:hypothetical protein
MLKRQNRTHQLTVNNISASIPYTDEVNGIEVYVAGGSLVFSTSFGLTITWDGNHRSEVSLCDAYAGYVCGLCGNADNNTANDFVDRRGIPVPLTGSKFTRHFAWGSTWRVEDDSIDIDNSS